MNHEGWFFGGGFMGLVWVLIIGVLILFVAFALKSGQKGGSGMFGGNEKLEDPLKILKSRYARGEIDEEEYERRKNELEKI